MTAIHGAYAGSAALPSILIKNLSFGFGDKLLFKNLNLDLGNNTQPGPFTLTDYPLKGVRIKAEGSPPDNSDNSPTVILGPSGCGKTTLLRLIAGLLKPWEGEVVILSCMNETGSITENRMSFVFQEPRLLPWKTVLENVMLPIADGMGKAEAEKRARHFLELVSLADKAASRPAELSGGQQQRAGIARAFAYPSPVILMDEPFQSLDIPLRISLMDLTNRMLENFPRLALMVTHDPREAVYMGNRIIVLGNSPGGIVFDGKVTLAKNERRYGSAVSAEIEEKLIKIISNDNEQG
jgi:NitT/TauT family transport system ATP-binding protein